MALIGPTEGEVEERRWHQPRHWESLGVTGSHRESLGAGRPSQGVCHP